MNFPHLNPAHPVCAVVIPDASTLDLSGFADKIRQLRTHLDLTLIVRRTCLNSFAPSGRQTTACPDDLVDVPTYSVANPRQSNQGMADSALATGGGA